MDNEKMEHWQISPLEMNALWRGLYELTEREREEEGQTPDVQYKDDLLKRLGEAALKPEKGKFVLLFIPQEG